MAQVVEESQDKEFGKNWVTSSRFLFYVTVFTFLAFVAGCSYSVYKSQYQGKPKVEVPTSTQYTPVYK